MTPSTVPDFFQEETADALRAQVDWLGQAVGVEDAFFEQLLRTDHGTFSGWRQGRTALPAGGEETLRDLWRAVLHLLSFLNFDLARAREVFQTTMPASPSCAASPLAPPWGGTSLKAYLERTGDAGIGKVTGWVTGLRFGDPYAA
jgi:hypothetical protein